MSKKVFFFTIFWLIVCLGNVNAVQQKLPFPGGETWVCTQGTAFDPLNVVNGEETNPTHKINSTMEYAWDFAFSGCLDEEVVASAAGEIARIVLEVNSGGWGNTVIIDYGDVLMERLPI